MENMNQVKDAYRSALKKKAMTFMPKNYDDVNAQKQILAMIVNVVPAAAGIMKAAETNLWPKVQAKSLPIIQAVGQCALEVNKAIGVNPLESLYLEKRSSPTLLKAWIALDYYAYLMLPEYSGNIRALRDRLLAILRQRDTGTAAIPVQKPAGNAGGVPQPPVPPAGQAEALKKTVVVSREGEMRTENMKTERVTRDNEKPFTTPSLVEVRELADAAPVTENPGRHNEQDRKEGKSGSRKVLAAVLVVLILAAAAAGGYFYANSAITEVETAIDAIGTVTLESEELIGEAEALYGELPEIFQNYVENYDTLTAAREEYDTQVAEVTEVETAIGDIDIPVTLDSREQVENARTLYDALEADQQERVSNYDTLQKLEEAYTVLYSEDQANGLYTSARQKYDQGSYEEAVTDLTELVTSYPDTSLTEAAKALGADAMTALAKEKYDDNLMEECMALLNEAQALFAETAASSELRSQLVTKLEAVRPYNGKLLSSKKIAWGYGTLNITATDGDICVKLVDKNDAENYSTYYIREGQTHTIQVEDGVYTLQYCYGDFWFSNEAMFGQDGTYKKIDFDVDLTTSVSGRKVSYEYYDVPLSTRGSGNWSETIMTREEF